jgi:hypothetical protein
VERYTVHPWQPELGPEEKNFVSENSKFLIFGDE